MTREGKRLPTDATPSNYNITIQPDLKNFTFEGEETIDITINNATNVLTLHCLDIAITNVSLKFEVSFGKQDIQDTQIVTGTLTDCEDIQYNTEDECVSFTFDDIIQPCSCKLIINYTGKLGDNLKGFYRSVQSNVGDDKQYAAVTHFEPTGARRAFPCWDEPAVKCTFDITLVVPEEKTAISNMHVIETSPLDNDPSLKVVKFATTPIMSTYIIAFIVGDFDFVEDVAENGVIVRVYTSVGKSQQGRFALEFAKKSLVYLENYFNVPYGLKKIDLIGISDFAIGAMENWGLVTYRERYLLFDEENTASSTKEFVTIIIAHELTHNWFGNLVSMEWWTDLWLKEGFASFMSYLCVDNFYKEFDIMTKFFLSESVRGQNLDALKNSHPIEVPVENPAQIAEIFDGISYSKGASILRMLHAYVGDEVFREALNTYLNKHQYASTVTDDLWKELGIASKKPIRDVMSTWTMQMGFPFIAVHRESLDSERQVLNLVQKKFCTGYRDVEGYHWKVPINLGCHKNGKIDHIRSLQSDDEMILYLDHGAATDWIKLNYGQADYYRVQYSEELMKELIIGINNKTVPPIDRLGIQNDLFALVCGGYSTTVEYITLLKAYSEETNWIVWEDILKNLNRLMKLLQRTNTYDQYKAFVIALLTPVSEKIGIEKSENDDHLKILLRNSVYLMLGSLGHESTVTRFNKQFNDLIENQVPIDPDIRFAVYATVSRHGNLKTFEKLKDLNTCCDSADETSRLLRSMGRCGDSEVRQNVLEYSISDSVRNQDTLAVLSGFCHSREGRLMAWNYVKSNWDTFQTRCSGGRSRSNLVVGIIEDFATEEEYEDAKKFLDEHPVDEAERAFKQAFENIRNNIDWLNRLSNVCSLFESS